MAARLTKESSIIDLPSVSGIARYQHGLGIKHLLGQLGNSQGSSFVVQGCKSWHEEVETGEGNHVDGQLPKVGVDLAGEAKAGGDSRHGQRDQMVQGSVGGSSELEGAEADVVQGLIVDAEGPVRVLDQLMHGEGCIVGSGDGVRYLGRVNDRVGVDHPVRILIPDFGDEESSHTGAGASSE